MSNLIATLRSTGEFRDHYTTHGSKLALFQRAVIQSPTRSPAPGDTGLTPSPAKVPVSPDEQRSYLSKEDASMTGTVKQPKGYKGMAMEGFVARWYARITRNSIEDMRLLAKRIGGQVARGSHILEVAPGPGYLAIEIAKLGSYQVSGLDISETFVGIARNNAGEAGVEINFRHGDAAYMPFDGDTFDFAVCRAAFKNFTQPVRALSEFYRVLKPGGKAVIVDLRPDASAEDIDAEVKKMGLNPIFTWMTKAAFRRMLLKNAHSEGEFKEFVSQTGFRTCKIERDTIGLEVWLEKAVPPQQ
jgi:ubiquinone/menaquinone biosynthesis C-methylase UbiE